MSSGYSSANGNPNGSGPTGMLPPTGLPPVAPPTAGFLARLFLVPAIIVTILVGVAFLFHLAFGWLLGSPSTPDQFLKKLDDPNPEVVWRAAADLSQVLLQKDRFTSDADRLATDPDFALELVKRLQQARKDTAAAELELATRFPPLSPDELDKMDDEAWLKRERELERENKKLEGKRNVVQFLAACLGNFTVPVGVPVLREMALQEKGIESGQLAQQRSAAVLALAVLGENCKRFDALNAIKQQLIIDKLEDALKDPEKGESARAALDHLRRRQEKLPDAMGVDLVMEKCSQADEPFLRELSAFALNFWEGNEAANQRMDEILDKLAHDDGRGTLTVQQMRKQAQRSALTDNPTPTTNSTTPPQLQGNAIDRMIGTVTPTISYTDPPQLQVIFNATLAQARRGSDKVNTGRLTEMLEDAKLRTQFLREDVATEKAVPDEGMVAQTIVSALKAVVELNKQRPNKITPRLREAVDKLKTHGNAAIKKEAELAAMALGAGQ